MIAKTCFPVRFKEIDLLGIVHHSNYPKWFERGRNDYLKNAGIPNYKLNALGFFLPLLKMECEFKSPAKFRDEILVITSLADISCVKLEFKYRIFNKSNGKALATGRTVHAWTNIKAEPINIAKEAPKIYTELKQLVAAADAIDHV